jgi:hypothetical protein
MPSYYDENKKCRTGTMDEAQFHEECTTKSSAFFRKLLAEWGKAGGTLKWGAGGVGLRGTIEGKETGICFLTPQFAGKKDRIELGCAALTKQLGQDRVRQLEKALRAAAGEKVLGKSMISIIEPGELALSQQNALGKVFLNLL